MAPIAISRGPTGEHIRQISRSVSSSLQPHDSNPSTRSIVTTSSLYVSSLASRALEFLGKITHPLPRHASSSISTSAIPISLAKRQSQILAIPTTYAGLNDGPAPGTVVGIVLGSVGGFLLALWLIYTCANMGGRFRRTTVVEEEVVRRRSGSPRRHSRSRSRSETIEVRSHSPRRESRRTETIVVEERVSRPARDEDDIVEVIEEHSPVRRPSKREKRTSGFRTVDPAEFGGGGAPMRKVSRRG